MIDLKKHPDATDSVKKEVCIQKSLHDSHILQLYGCRTQGDIEYIFLEYAAGGELFDRIEPDIGMVPKQAQQFFTQLMAGVEYLHNRGIAHRDLKPENLLLDEHDNLKISDFGMATMFRCKGKERLLDKRCGTLPYVAPEVLSKPYKAMPADLWSCGIILVTMLAGELPWDQPTEACIDYTKWEKSSDWSTSMPWKKLDTMSLSLIRNMLKCTPKDRYTLEQIKNHVWYRSDLRGSDSLDGSLLNPSNPMEKRHCSNHRLGGSADDLFGRDICSQPNPVPNENNPMDVAIEAMNDFCFSQPAMIDDIILCTQQNLTQTASQNQFQRLVRRMTRFYVASSAEEAGKNLLTALAKLNYNVKSHDDGVVTISTLDRKKSPLIFKANVIEMNGKILLDFRLSKGCGLEFKRDFIKIKNLLSDHIVKCSINWPLGNKC